MPIPEIIIAGGDYADQTLFSSARFNSQVNAAAGDCYLRLRDPDRSLAFLTGASILLVIDGEAVWRGFISQWARKYVFPALNVDAFGETRFFDIIGTDINVLFTKRIIFNQATPALVEGKLYPPFTADETMIADLVTDYLDLSSDTIDTSTFVDNVGDSTIDQEGRAWSAGDTWGQGMQSIANLPAAIYYLRPTLTGADLVYCDVDTPNAAYAMNDVPTPGAVGYREMEVLLDGTGLVNDQLAWGIGYGSQTPVFVRDQDAVSQAQHGLWQAGKVAYGVYKQGTIDRIAASIVDGSPQSKRGAKNDRVAVMCSTWQTGFLPSQKIDFTSQVWEFNDVIPIRKMEVTFEARDNPKYALTLSHEIDTPFGLIDPFFFNYSLPPLPPMPPLPPYPPNGGGTSPICGITDDFQRVETLVWDMATCGLVWTPITSTGAIALSVDGDAGIVNLLGGSATITSQQRLGGSGVTPHTEPFDADAIKVLRFQIPDGDNPFALDNGMQLRWSCVGGIGTASPRILINGSLSEISFIAFPSGTAIPAGFWSPTSTYRWTVFMQDAFTVATSITDGIDTYTATLADVPTDARCLFTAILEQDSPFVTGNHRVRVLDIDIPEITACTLGNSLGDSMPVNPNGFGCEIPARVEPTIYQCSNSILAGSSRVWINGLRQRRGIDYTEAPVTGRLTFTDPLATTDKVIVCYVATGPLG